MDKIFVDCEYGTITEFKRGNILTPKWFDVFDFYFYNCDENKEDRILEAFPDDKPNLVYYNDIPDILEFGEGYCSVSLLDIFRLNEVRTCLNLIKESEYNTIAFNLIRLINEKQCLKESVYRPIIFTHGKSKHLGLIRWFSVITKILLQDEPQSIYRYYSQKVYDRIDDEFVRTRLKRVHETILNKTKI